MTKHAQLADGTVLEFPDDTPDEVMDRAVQSHVNNPPNDSGLTGFISGALKPFDNLTRAAMHIPGMDMLDRAGQAIGLPSAAAAVAGNNAARDSNSAKGWQAAGNFVGTLPTAYLPGGALAQGAAGGALLSDANDATGLLQDTALGGLSSKAVGAALNTAGSVIAPRLSPAVRRLRDAGVNNLTLGQILSDSKGAIPRMVSKAEEALTSVPVLGDMINMAREAGTNSYERALGNRVLGNVGKKLPDSVGQGEDLIGYVKNKIGSAYDNLVPNLSMNFDNQFATDLTKAKGMVATLPDHVQTQFAKIVQDVFTNRANPSNRGMAGQALKDAESSLSGFMRKYAKSTNGDQTILADALGGVRQSLRDAVSRANPAFADELQSLNTAWAQLRPMSAVSSQTPGGQITPARMFQAVRKTGFNDPLAKSAAKVMHNTTPDSGTARRAMAALATGIGGGGVGAVALNPMLAIPAALASLYTKGGVKVVNKALLAERGKAANAVADATRWIGSHAGSFVPGLLGYMGGK